MGAHSRHFRRINFKNRLIDIGTDRLDRDDARPAHQAFNIHAQHIIIDAPLTNRALRTNISGLVPGGAQVYWNIKKN